MNEYKDIEDRRNATKILLENELRLLKDGYNPILKKNVLVSNKVGELHPGVNIIEALKLSYDKLKTSEHHLKQVRWCLSKLIPFFQNLEYGDVKISDIKIFHIKNILDRANLIPHMYNKFRSY